jgi:hypothetical protein
VDGIPSRGRIWLSGVVDFLLFGCVFSFLVWPIGHAAPWATSQVVRVGAFAVVWMLTVRLAGATPGSLVLGLRREPTGWEQAEDPPERETRWTLAAGLAWVWFGYSSLTHIADGLPPRPFFGMHLPPIAGYLAVSIAGALTVVSGLLMLRGKAIGAILALVSAIVEGVGSMVAPEAMSEWIEQMVVTRRALQGIPVRPGEVALMQTSVTLTTYVMALVGIPWLLLVYRRLREDD